VKNWLRENENSFFIRREWLMDYPIPVLAGVVIPWTLSRSLRFTRRCSLSLPQCDPRLPRAYPQETPRDSRLPRSCPGA